MENRNMENVDNTDNTVNIDKLSEHEFSAEYKAKKESLLAGMRDMEESGRPTSGKDMEEWRDLSRLQHCCCVV